MVSRRDFLKIAGMGAGAAFVAACGPRLLLDDGAPLPLVTAATATPAAASIPVTAAQPALVSPSAMPAAASKYQGRKLCFVLWDQQLERYAYRPRNMKHPVPQTCPLYSGSSMRVTPAWAEYWRAILRLCNPGMSTDDFEQGWKGLIASDRAFTNGTGPEDNRDHWAVHSLTCGGATHEMVTGIVEKHGIRIYTLNWTHGPPPVPEKREQIDMTRHFFATTAGNVRFPDGTYAVNGFPQFENCIVPLASNDDTDFIDASRVKPVCDIQMPYHTWASQMPRVGKSNR